MDITVYTTKRSFVIGRVVEKLSSAFNGLHTYLVETNEGHYIGEFSSKEETLFTARVEVNKSLLSWLVKT